MLKRNMKVLISFDLCNVTKTTSDRCYICGKYIAPASSVLSGWPGSKRPM